MADSLSKDNDKIVTAGSLLQHVTVCSLERNEWETFIGDHHRNPEEMLKTVNMANIQLRITLSVC